LVEPIETLIASNLGLNEIDLPALKALPNLTSIDLTNNPLSNIALVEQVTDLETNGIAVVLGGMETERLSFSTLAKNSQLPLATNVRTLITVHLLNAKQEPVNHEIVTLTTNYGKIQSPAENQGDGTYTSVYRLDAVNQNQTKQITISATTQNKKTSNLELSIINQPLIVGDINYDQQVDIQDLVWVANNFGHTGQHLIGDLNNDQKIDLFDLTMVAQNFARSSAPIVLMNEEPQALILYQNYPNPFNPETWIPFELDRETTVNLEIHDISGQLVRRLSLGQLPAGKYLDRQSSAHWDGRSKYGEQVSSGVYFYTVVTDQQRLTKHMMILK